MRSAWQTQSLGELCKIIGGGTPRKNKANFYSGDIPWATVRDMRKEVIKETEFRITKEAVRDSSTNIIPAGNVIIATRVGLGKVCLLGQDTAINQDLRAVIPRDPEVLCNRFLYWWLKSISDVIVAQGTGATVQGIRVSFVSALKIPLPTLLEQQRIVDIIDEAFAGLTIAKANAEKNLQNARFLFESGLEAAITGELTWDWRRDHGTGQNAERDLMLRLGARRGAFKEPGQYKPPAKPIARKPIDLPRSWVLASPEEITTHIVDCPHTTPRWAKSGVLCLRTTNFKPGVLDLESAQYVSEQTYQERIARLEPKPGDILYSREGGILGIACVIPDGLRTCLGQRMMLFRLDAKLVLPTYFSAVMNSLLILSEVKRLTGGTASPHLNIRDIRTFPIPLPPISEQRQIVAKLDALTAETRRLEAIYRQKLTALDDLKKSLLHQAFTGQLTTA